MYGNEPKESYDQLAIGSMIKKIRKSKGITLEELARGICSTGKMSNIENGATSVDKETLNLFATKLGVPIKQFTDAHSEEEKIIFDKLAKIEQLMGFKLYDDAHKNLNDLIDLLDVSANLERTFQIKAHYFDGLLYKIKGNMWRATAKFYRVLDFPITSMDDIVYVARTYHNLAELHHQANERTKAIELLEKGIDMYASKNLDIPWVFHYNLAILYLFLSNPLKADIHIRSIRRHNAAISYIDSLSHLMNGNLNIGMKKLGAVRREILEEEDQELLARSLLTHLYFSTFSPTEYEVTLNHTILPFIEKEMLKLDFTNNVQKKFIYLMLSCVVIFMVKRKNFELTEKYINLTKEFDELHKIEQYRYVIPYLKAFYTKSLAQKDNKLLKEYLIETKNLMEKERVSNLSYYSVLVELSQLEDEPETYAAVAIRFMNGSFNLDTIDIIEREHLLPPFKEINI